MGTFCINLTWVVQSTDEIQHTLILMISDVPAIKVRIHGNYNYPSKLRKTQRCKTHPHHPWTTRRNNPLSVSQNVRIFISIFIFIFLFIYISVCIYIEILYILYILCVFSWSKRLHVCRYPHILHIISNNLNLRAFIYIYRRYHFSPFPWLKIDAKKSPWIRKAFSASFAFLRYSWVDLCISRRCFCE